MNRLHLNPKVSVSVVFVAALFMSIMDTTIVNVALPSLGRELHTPSTALDAVVVGYLISLAAVIQASGWLGDRWCADSINQTIQFINQPIQLPDYRITNSPDSR